MYCVQAVYKQIMGLRVYLIDLCHITKKEISQGGIALILWDARRLGSLKKLRGSVCEQWARKEEGRRRNEIKWMGDLAIEKRCEGAAEGLKERRNCTGSMLGLFAEREATNEVTRFRLSTLSVPPSPYARPSQCVCLGNVSWVQQGR